MGLAKTCFFIAPIGEKESEVRKRSDQVLKHVVTPVAEKFKYSVLRADQIDKPGLITSQVIQHVFDSELVIADLSGFNPNVFYELALRHAVRKPFVQIAEESQKIPFDIAGLRTISLNHHDLDSVERCKNELENQIQSIAEGADAVESPVSVAVNVQALQQSAMPMEKSLAEIMNMLQGLSRKVSELDSQRYVVSSQPLRYATLLTPTVSGGEINPLLTSPGVFHFGPDGRIVRIESPAGTEETEDSVDPKPEPPGVRGLRKQG